MSALYVRIFPETLRSANASTFTGSYQALGSPLGHSIRLVKWTNTSNVDVTISWDGINDHEILPANSFVLLDVSSNREVSNQWEIQNGLQFYIKAAVGVGSVYMSAYFAY